MDFSLTDEQQLLRDSVAGFLTARYELEKSRSAAKSVAGWQPEIWRGFAEELGILGATLAERVDGMGGGPTELMVIAEELGHALVVEPFVDTVVVGGGLLSRVGGERADAVLRDIVAGSARIAFAALEPSAGESAHDISLTARRDGDEWVLDGSKIVVTSAPLATHLIISARTSGERRDRDGVSLFLTEFDASAPSVGLEVHSYRTIDDRQAADLTFTGFRLPATALLGAEGEATANIEATLEEAIAAVAAESVGLMRKVVADTVEYSKQRQQFGQPIGQFQVLQHRMVDMYMELEQATAAAYLAAFALSSSPSERARAISATKVTIARAARFIGQQSVQLHGAMGMTEELAIGHYFKRLTAIENEFGSSAYHLNRYARLTRP
ncbi:acyl-CoA dehydrogenase family protein [Nocardia cyriacigeorgica]|jgi:alkylation response protein AidB-like acyl-CoA dehydrogenase|uniref:acyl-CoA dehydrogenase family protein n=1 Tax=Nocardia cyriacigeorgica TaxID=135487 RepID=UPI0002F194C8|nr:acyl-CoA dehydrogenase [Nocardia cyriacigeorgica]AVH21735.1 acyl-CoA dehydrogenase [Nocardia cyriacigeorgica]MBF6085777.1 acyl-CoA dehydrogenase family protein [Nocardia cyriacigeorgica]MBF6321221.1 acyl-CoA dehydrogenase family protein [Nocardia cyriacigeorgica]MBF6495085.1 acyl-CoA dehydrogenase family protein [Nocardia cyriacigeorgica]PPJ12787.1 acyl-CoA dehydrogenase [Nocardia cyriacigeorgica]